MICETQVGNQPPCSEKAVYRMRYVESDSCFTPCDEHVLFVVHALSKPGRPAVEMMRVDQPA